MACFTERKKTKSLLYSFVIVLSLLLNSSVVVHANSDDIGGSNDDCPGSILLKGKELLGEFPELSGHFQTENRSEEEASEESVFWPKLPDWLEVPTWSWPFLSSDSSDSNGASDSGSVSRELLEEQEDSSGNLADLSSEWVTKAENTLRSHGFEDNDGDGYLNWPEDIPGIGGQNLDIVVVLTESSGVVIGFVPIAGDAVDVVAIVIAKDPITGECLTKTDQLLFALSLLIVIPISAKTLKLVGQQVGKSGIDLPSVWKTLKSTLKGLGFEPHTWLTRLDEGFEWTFKNAKDVKRLNRVAVKYWRYRVIVGRGATSSGEMARRLELNGFTESNYREALIKFTGKSEDEVEGLEAHHILPQEHINEFQKRGFETIHDPRLLVWVDPTEHRKWSNEYGEAWKTFFQQKPNATQKEILEEARMLADEFGYRVLFRTSSWDIFRQISWPFGG